MKALIIFGSTSDKDVYNGIAKGLDSEGIEYDLKVLSAHRTPKEVSKIKFDKYFTILAGAGLAAHLPGVIAAKTSRPVIGVPCNGAFDGLDSWLAIVQMPPGTPVLCVGVNNFASAAIGAKLIKDAPSTFNLCFSERGKAVEKAMQTLSAFRIKYSESKTPLENTINIIFSEVNDPLIQAGLSIFCPVADKSYATDAVSWMKKANDGMWVGLNRGENAVLAAMQVCGKYNKQLAKYKAELRKKI